MGEDARVGIKRPRSRWGGSMSRVADSGRIAIVGVGR